ncbi:cell wall shape-determining protein [Sulfuricella sp. T08]|uniref:rod shape-determining protein RodA n=1 Tax=Sulfuricella sp. T08 TaxID=1632857 RepID=UPI0006179BE3|nr:rod shape-determining protein RodA [Sulfuricella sp. T08]GAO36811.1 cell wall shape-determining protein [Sulfuricella sp. T08]
MIKIDPRRIWLWLTAHIDSLLLSFMLMLMLIGLIVLYSATGQDLGKTTGQMLNMLVALVAMWAVANVSPQHIARAALPVYGLGLLLLIGVALFGDVSHGARRWLNIGIRIQPSEMMKLAVPLMLAWYLDRREKTLNLKDFGVAVLLLVAPVGLIVKQPDLGTALLISASGFYALFLAGLSWRIILGLVGVGAASAPILWSLMHDYQRQRILTLIDPSQDPLGAGYHIIQSSIALGSGGIFGKGWFNGTQTHLDFLPERTTDFIFAVYGEEFGLAGNLILLAVYILVIGRGLVIAAKAPTLFSRLLAGSITLTFFTYAFVNMGMVSGILPVVGVPLPLISYGGTSMVTLLVGFGMLMSIQTHRKLVQS